VQHVADLDLRGLALGSAAWAGALLGAASPSSPGWLEAVALAVSGVVVAAVLLAWRSGNLSGRTAATSAALVAVTTVVAVGTTLRLVVVEDSTVAAQASQRAVVDVLLDVRSDPSVHAGPFGDVVVVPARTVRVLVRGVTVTERVRVVVLGDPEGEPVGWEHVALGSRVRVTGRLLPSDESGSAALLDALGPPAVVRSPPAAFRVADGVRASVRRSAAPGPGEAAHLVPALVTGDDQALSDEVEDDFRTTGLTHLTAVSGTNLTLVLGFLLVVARWGGVRARGLLVVGVLGVVGFVLLARPEPSVLRAAVMGTVALLGMQSAGRAAGTRALGVAVLALLLVDPALATSAGFALSVLATGGILLVGPRLRDALAGWLPRPWAEAVAVPLAAQVACTPLVAGLSGQVSLVAVLANLVVAPVVGPATVLGLLGGLVGLAVPPAGAVLGWAAGWCAWWIVLVAEQGSRLPTAAVGWPTGLAGLSVLTFLCLVVLGRVDRLLRHRGPALGAAVLLVAVIVLPTSPWDRLTGWPPQGWVLVMCDVGQGDGLVLEAGAGAALVVDVGPDPILIDRCLRRLRVESVPAVVLTHFHADHVDGLPGVLRGRSVGEVVTSPLRVPEPGAVAVERWSAAAGVPVRAPASGEVGEAGPLRWQVAGSLRTVSDSPNDASLVLVMESHGLRILLSGDIEPAAQAMLDPGILGPVDVLKVPHHGSRYQDPDLLSGLGARVALVSAGEDNDYGHPAPDTLRLLESAGMLVRRTDEDGDIAVVVDDRGDLRVVTRD